MPTLVFISHSSEDRQTAELLVDVLTQALAFQPGDVFYSGAASSGLRPGESVRDGLRRHLNEARVVLALWTHAAQDSGYVQPEMGSAWQQSKLVILLESSQSIPHVPEAFQDANHIILAKPDQVISLIGDLAQKTQTAQREEPEYSTQLRRLASQVEESGWPDSAAEGKPLLLLKRPQSSLGWFATAVQAAVLLFFLLCGLTYMVIPIEVSGTLYSDNGAYVKDAQVRVDSQVSMTTDDYGSWRFRVNGAGILRPYRISVNLPGESRPRRGDFWPWPWLMMWRSQSIELYLEGDRDVRIGSAHLPSSPWAAFAQTPRPSSSARAPSAARPVPAPAGNWELGLFVESLKLSRLPGLIWKPQRAFFEVRVGQQRMSDAEIVAEARTLGGKKSLFPIKTRLNSWIVVRENDTRQYEGLYCRLPRADSAQLGNITLLLIGDGGERLAEFDFKPDFSGVLRGDPFVTVTDSQRQAEARLRLTAWPAKLNVDWRPSAPSVGSGGELEFQLLFEDGKTAPLAFSPTLSVSTLSGNATAQFLAPAAFTTGASQTRVRVRFGGRGKVRLQSVIPKGLGGGSDDSEVTVR